MRKKQVVSVLAFLVILIFAGLLSLIALVENYQQTPGLNQEAQNSVGSISDNTISVSSFSDSSTPAEKSREILVVEISRKEEDDCQNLLKQAGQRVLEAEKLLESLRQRFDKEGPYYAWLASLEADNATEEERQFMKRTLEWLRIRLRPEESIWFLERLRNNDWHLYHTSSYWEAIVIFLGPRRILEEDPGAAFKMKSSLPEQKWQELFGPAFKQPLGAPDVQPNQESHKE